MTGYADIVSLLIDAGSDIDGQDKVVCALFMFFIFRESIDVYICMR